jgi:iron complex transport system substrate-binding protein
MLFWASACLADIRLPQADGSLLELPAPATRLVTLSPHLAELVYSAGAGRHLIATVEYSDYPAAVVLTPRVGDAFRIDIERIITLKPDLVIAWDSGNPRPAVEQLRKMGLPVWTVEIRDLDQIATVIELIGELSNESAAHEAAEHFRNRLQALALHYDARPVLDYFYQVAARPLFTINGEHLISKGLELCGGHNIFSEQSGLAFQVSHESVIAADPDALFAPGLENETNPLSSWQEWTGMKATRQQALFLLPADEISRATPRILVALELACSLLDELRARSIDE